MNGGIGGASTGRGTNRLTDRAIKAFLGKLLGASSKKLSDGGGLYLTTTRAGTPVWRLKYRLDGKEKLYSIGPYPSIGLEAARAARELVKAQLREGRDPVSARRVSRVEASTSSANIFGDVADEWLMKRKRDWSAVHYEKSKRALERDVIPTLGRLPVGEVTSAMIAKVIERITNRGAHDTAAKVLWHVICVFRFAQAKGLCTENPALPVRELLPRKRQTGRRPALLELDALRDVLRRAELASLSPAVRLAHRLCAFTAARIGNVVGAEWSEFDLDGETPTWTIPRAKMKSRAQGHNHRVILSPTIAAELRAWQTLTGGTGRVFPSPTGNAYISREAIEKVYKVTLSLRGKHSPHGWRAAFATLARDAGYARDVVELTLDHVHDTEVVRAYDRGERFKERVELMRWWDSQLVGGRPL